VSEQQSVRERLAKTFRFIIAQRLIPREDGGDRIVVVEILKSNSRTRDCVEQGERPGRTLLDAMKSRRERRHAAFRQRDRETGPLGTGRSGNWAFLCQQRYGVGAGTG